MISELGNNLNFIINSKNNSLSNWQSFALSYSIRKFAPDSKIYINCFKEKLDKIYFSWCYKLGIKIYYNKNVNIKNSIVFPYTSFLMIRELTEEDLSCLNNNNFELNNVAKDIKSDDFCSLVNYEKGFNGISINTKEPPFTNINLYAINNMTVNEIKVLQLFSSIGKLYLSI